MAKRRGPSRVRFSYQNASGLYATHRPLGKQSYRVTKGGPMSSLTTAQRRNLKAGHRMVMQSRMNAGTYGMLTSQGRMGKSLMKQAGYKPGAFNAMNANRRRVTGPVAKERRARNRAYTASLGTSRSQYARGVATRARNRRVRRNYKGQFAGSY